MPTTQASASLAEIATRFVTVEEFARRRCINKLTAYRWLKSAPERLPRVTRLHGRVLFLERDVRAFFETFEAACGAPAHEDVSAPRPRRGRPRKAEEVARRVAATAGGVA